MKMDDVGQAGPRGLEKPGIAEGVPWQGAGARWTLISIPTQIIPWFYVYGAEFRTVMVDLRTFPGLLTLLTEVHPRGRNPVMPHALASSRAQRGGSFFLQMVAVPGQGLCPPHVWEHQICFGLWQHYCKVISLFGPCDFSRGRGERQSPAALTDSLQGPRGNSVLCYKFPFVKLPGLIDLGAKFPLLKEDPIWSCKKRSLLSTPKQET